MRFVLESIEPNESRPVRERVAPKLSMNPVTLYAWVNASAPGPARPVPAAGSVEELRAQAAAAHKSSHRSRGASRLGGSINSSCRPGHVDCVSAFELGAGNSVSVLAGPDANGGFSVFVELTATNPFAPVIPLVGRLPAINMTITAGRQSLSRPGSPSLGVEEYLEPVAFVEVHGDDYPSIEAYWNRQRSTFTAVRDREGWAPGGLPVGLVPPWPNRNLHYEVAM